MGQLKRLIREIHRRSVWQVLLIYVGAAWACYEIIEAITERLVLPEWLPVFAIVLFLIGLPVVLATAFVQEGIPARESETVAPGGETDEPGGPPSGAREDAGLGRLFTWRNAIAGGVLALALWGVVATGWLILAERGEPAPAGGDAASPAVAILPFRVVGEDLELYREGMVDLLAANLDGAAGFRTSDPRTLINRWRRQVGEGLDHPDLEVALEVARGVDARYAILGSAVDLGDDIRLSAEVYDLANGDRIGRTGLEGSADSVAVLVDRLSIDLFREIAELGPEEPPDFDVREVTTTSLPALKAYLAGERKLRRGRFGEAVTDYSRAIEQDSTFALALQRISLAYGWAEGATSPRAFEFAQRAARYIDELPPRAALLVQAHAELEEQRRSSIETLRGMTRRYPDDVEAHYYLGDAHYHLGGRSLYTPAAYREAFRTALDLDPSYAPAYIHLIEDAFHRRDSADVSALLERYLDYSPGGLLADESRLMQDLVWGQGPEREAARAALDTASAGLLARMATRLSQAGAYPLEASLLVARERAEDRHPDGGRGAQVLLFIEYLRRGRVQEAREAGAASVRGPDFPRPVAEAMTSAWLSLLGYPISDSPDYPLPEPPDELRSFPHYVPRWFNAAYAARQGRLTDLEREVARFEADAEDAASAGDEGARLNYGSLAHGLRVYAAVVRDDLEAAAAGYDRPMPRADGWLMGFLRYSMGQAYLADGNPTEAVRYLGSLRWFSPVQVPVQYYLGEAYEALGDQENARLHYARFLRWWEDADPELEPWKERARRALRRLHPDRRVE